MEIIVQKIDVRKGTIDYICTELRKLIHLQPRQEGKINLSLDLTKSEDISVFKHEDEAGSWFSFSWNIGKKHYVYGNISCDITKMVQDVERMYDDVTAKVREEAEKAIFEDRCYKLYQLEWMMSHGYSLDDLYKVMLKYEQDMFDPEDFGDGEYGHGHVFDASDLERAAMQARDIFLYQEGFGGSQIFADKEEFLDAEYQDAAYMKWLFETQVDEEADKLKALYTKYTGKQLSCVADLKVHTEVGTLRAYRLTDPEHPGICVMLQPKGHDVEIDVTMAESDGKNINIVNWGDATTEDSTHRETLLGDDIEATLRPRVLSKEELKPIIFDEWKKFTFYDGENISADEIDNVPQELLDEIAFRCDSLETDDITQNIRACLQYAKDHGTRALIKEMDDCNIWRYIG
ncbi:MAG: hypothetical protein J6I68_14345 [Butyrivibrio sp.]|uniref:hypothetical protein n=1 Tax=Butyrivibrio sp. TaxID=28121 RepID=UPI001B539A1A|nr:hypothetical protein [Butyrivibrio sp.]MBP3784421.1 hypothetical protein [Butyrivibrio sp.]